MGIKQGLFQAQLPLVGAAHLAECEGLTEVALSLSKIVSFARAVQGISFGQLIVTGEFDDEAEEFIKTTLGNLVTALKVTGEDLSCEVKVVENVRSTWIVTITSKKA